jgi:hypothetical protein
MIPNSAINWEHADKQSTSEVMIKVFWDVEPCSNVEVDRLFKGAYCLHHKGDDGGSTHLWNVGQLQRDYTALHPRRL